MAKVYIGLGSNLSDPHKQIHLAIDALKDIETCKLINLSSLYFSRPMGPQDQPDYMNAVAEITTQLSPLSLLDKLQAIENSAGRVRKDNRWGARILDLDILLFDNKVINSERLTLPHYGLELREFVLLPLAEISPALMLPNGKSIAILSQTIDSNELKIHSKLR
jgi:2-amino-4-hydroxy-6-hydroxymethyldihydropteridine diphosphokinase